MTTPDTMVQHYHEVVDCQYACPAHTPVPEYIRLIAEGRYTDSYMLNWESNVFPGVLGRVCDRPCEPACRRGRLQEEPVAICRLKRVASDFKDDIQSRLPKIPEEKNGKRIALIGAGPASLTVARDLMPLGYEITVIDEQQKGGGMIRSQIPSFRLPDTVIDEEVGYILDMGVDTRFGEEVTSLKSILDEKFDAVFIGTGAPRGRNLEIPGRYDAEDHIHIGVEWLANVSFKHTNSIGEKVVILGGGNTAMDCCRTARRLGGKEVTVTVRSPFAEMKASPWEIEDAQHEGIPVLDNHVPVQFHCEDGKLNAIEFQLVRAEYDAKGKRSLIPTGEDNVIIECTDVIVAVGQENSFPWIERDIGIEFNDWDMPEVDKITYRTSHKKVFVAGDAAWGPENIITAVAQAHQAAISIDLFCNGKRLSSRPGPNWTLVSQKMGIHEWSYQNNVVDDERYAVPLIATDKALADLSVEVELGFDANLALQEAHRCFSCDAQTVFNASKCIECDACIDICPTDCLTMTHYDPSVDDVGDLRQRLTGPAANNEQPIYVSGSLPDTGRVMVKDENVCVHCGLCAERCPTAAWDMQKLLYTEAQAGDSCQK